MRLIIGLGNPGVRYKFTRHNLGFLIVDNLAARYRVRLRKRAYFSTWAEAWRNGERIILVRPTTYMNQSGVAVNFWVEKESIDLKDILIVCDDISLPFGSFRMRRQGSAGGHKGLTSIIEHLGSEEFPRLRVGIGSPRKDAADFVLDKFTRQEQILFLDIIGDAASACESWIHEGLESAMNKFNIR